MQWCSSQTSCAAGTMHVAQHSEKSRSTQFLPKARPPSSKLYCMYIYSVRPYQCTSTFQAVEFYLPSRLPVPSLPWLLVKPVLYMPTPTWLEVLVQIIQPEVLHRGTVHCTFLGLLSRGWEKGVPPFAVCLPVMPAMPGMTCRAARLTFQFALQYHTCSATPYFLHLVFVCCQLLCYWAFYSCFSCRT
jgi:hypothetical protein